MSCWVVPGVAAELWGLSIANVLKRIEIGEIPSKTELGFMLVDVAPEGPRIKKIREPGGVPRTFVEMEESVDDGREETSVFDKIDWHGRRKIGRFAVDHRAFNTLRRLER